MLLQSLLQAIIGGLMEGGLYALIGLGLSIIFGVMGIVNLAHGQLMMIASYITYWLFILWGVDPFISIPASMAVLFVLGWLIQKFTLNPIIEDPMMSLLLTYGIALLLENTALSLWTADYRLIATAYSTKAIEVSGLVVNFQRLAIIAITFIVMIVFYLLLTRTWFGKAMRACAQDRETAMLMGINFNQVACFTFALCASIVAVAGSLYVTTHYITPISGGLFTLKAFCIVVLGGMGSVIGATAGGFLLGITEALTSMYISTTYKDMIGFIFLIVMLIIKPSGLFGKATR
jgi:branched-chain amino acid transport system permease protein